MSRIEMRSSLTLHSGLEARERHGCQACLSLGIVAFRASGIGRHKELYL
jgi:hypothetical protein